MYLPNTNSQSGLHRLFRGDGALTSSVTPLLVLPQALSRAVLLVQNISAANMWMETGCARATATITNGAVTSIAITNGGFGFTKPPIVEFAGGGGPVVANSAWNGVGLIGSAPPQGANTQTSPASFLRPAVGAAVLTLGVVTSITILDPGQGYVNKPEIIMANDPLDPFGCADPSAGGGSGQMLVASGGSYYNNGTACPSDAIALFGTSGSKFYAGYML